MNRCLLCFMVISLCFVSFSVVKAEGDKKGNEPTALSKLPPEEREALLECLKELAPQAGSKWFSFSNATITAFSTLGTVFTTSLAWACYYWKTNPVALTNLALASLNAWVCSKTNRDVNKVHQALKTLREEVLRNREQVIANLELLQQLNAKEHSNLSNQLDGFGQELAEIKNGEASIRALLDCVKIDIADIRKNGVTTEILKEELAASVAKIEAKIDSLRKK